MTINTKQENGLDLELIILSLLLLLNSYILMNEEAAIIAGGVTWVFLSRTQIYTFLQTELIEKTYKLIKNFVWFIQKKENLIILSKKILENILELKNKYLIKKKINLVFTGLYNFIYVKVSKILIKIGKFSEIGIIAQYTLVNKIIKIIYIYINNILEEIETNKIIKFYIQRIINSKFYI